MRLRFRVSNTILVVAVGIVAFFILVPKAVPAL